MSGYGSFGFHYIRLAGVYFFLFILLMMNLVDINFLSGEGGRLSFLLVGLYFWSVYRPSLLPYPVVFGGGLTLDFLSGGPVGLYTLCFMVMVIIVRGQRRFLLGQSWPVIWAGFCVAVLLVTAIQVAVFGLSAWSLPPLMTAGFNLVISFLLYPLFLPLMMVLNRMLSD